MGQKANPNAIRLGINRPWDATWYPSNNKDFAKYLIEDKTIRTYIEGFERKYFIGRIIINRPFKPLSNKENTKVVSTETTNKENSKDNDRVSIDIYTSRPGVILGKDGSNIKELTLNIKKLLKDRNKNIELNIKEISNPDLSAKLVANEIAIALENRVPFRIIQKKMISRVMRAGALGVKTKVSGRLNGVDMARSEGYSRGVVPLQTFRNDIDFAISEANTTYGILGIKVWISKKEILKGTKLDLESEERPRSPRNPRNNNRGDNRFSRDNNSNNPNYRGSNTSGNSGSSGSSNNSNYRGSNTSGNSGSSNNSNYRGSNTSGSSNNSNYRGSNNSGTSNNPNYHGSNNSNNSGNSNNSRGDSSSSRWGQPLNRGSNNSKGEAK